MRLPAIVTNAAVLVVIEVPRLPRRDRPEAPRAERQARLDIALDARPQTPMRPTVKVVMTAHRSPSPTREPVASLERQEPATPLCPVPPQPRKTRSRGTYRGGERNPPVRSGTVCRPKEWTPAPGQETSAVARSQRSRTAAAVAPLRPGGRREILRAGSAMGIAAAKGVAVPQQWTAA